mmetsp:Transcript_22564/g.69924  ORF Transcript_22564/g.69924 Transcript_22564/m.69924 type:complete len:673 (-) Transcript_22564:163-2181(-)
MQPGRARPLARPAALLLLGALAQGAAVTPVQKVIQMLTDMRTKGAKEAEVERTVFMKYKLVTEKRVRQLSKEIEKATAKSSELSATISKYQGDVKALGGQIQELEGEISTLEADRKAAAEVRKSESAQYDEQHLDYQQSLDALDQAAQMLTAQNFDREQATALLQKKAQTLPGMRRVLAALELLQLGGRSAEAQPSGAPAVAAYEFQSGKVISMLKGLRKQFREQLHTLEKEEMDKAQAYNMQDIHMKNTLANVKSERKANVETKARIAADLAAAKDDLAEAESRLTEAQQFLADTKATFTTKQAVFTENQKVRKEELAALAKALEIMSDPEVGNSYATRVKSLVQRPAPPRRATSLLQLHAGAGRGALRRRAATFLRGRAETLHSGTLAALAGQMVQGPFDKVIEMIESLLERLKDEAASEAEHKAYCDEELRKNKLKRNEKESAVDRLYAEVESKAAAIKEMDKDLASLAQEQADLRTSMTESTATRAEEKEENEAAIKDSAAAQVAVKQAIEVLRDYYEKQAALAQVGARRQAPEMEAYGGMGRASGGVVAMLEVIESDFARVEASTRASETQAAEEYKSFMEEAEEDIKLKHEAEFKLGLKKDQAEFEHEQLQKDLDATQEQLKMANQYYEELKPQCLTTHVSFEERAAKRQEEIDALKEAYNVLDSK